jgi:hypothetical protein
MKLEIKTNKGYRNPLFSPELFKGLSTVFSYDAIDRHLILFVHENAETYRKLKALEAEHFKLNGESPKTVEVR